MSNINFALDIVNQTIGDDYYEIDFNYVNRFWFLKQEFVFFSSSKDDLLEWIMYAKNGQDVFQEPYHSVFDCGNYVLLEEKLDSNNQSSFIWLSKKLQVSI